MPKKDKNFVIFKKSCTFAAEIILSRCFSVRKNAVSLKENNLYEFTKKEVFICDYGIFLFRIYH